MEIIHNIFERRKLEKNCRELEQRKKKKTSKKLLKNFDQLAAKIKPHKKIPELKFSN